MAPSSIRILFRKDCWRKHVLHKQRPLFCNCRNYTHSVKEHWSWRSSASLRFDHSNFIVWSIRYRCICCNCNTEIQYSFTDCKVYESCIYWRSNSRKVWVIYRQTRWRSACFDTSLFVIRDVNAIMVFIRI